MTRGSKGVHQRLLADLSRRSWRRGLGSRGRSDCGNSGTACSAYGLVLVGRFLYGVDRDRSLARGDERVPEPCAPWGPRSRRREATRRRRRRRPWWGGVRAHIPRPNQGPVLLAAWTPKARRVGRRWPARPHGRRCAPSCSGRDRGRAHRRPTFQHEGFTASVPGDPRRGVPGGRAALTGAETRSSGGLTNEDVFPT